MLCSFKKKEKNSEDFFFFKLFIGIIPQFKNDSYIDKMTIFPKNLCCAISEKK